MWKHFIEKEKIKNGVEGDSKNDKKKNNHSLLAEMD